jgi:hypothetical protein
MSSGKFAVDAVVGGKIEMMAEDTVEGVPVLFLLPPLLADSRCTV